MSLFEPPVVCDLTPDEWDRFTRPVDAPEGGMGALWQTLHDRASERRLEAEDAELSKAYRYSYDYGGGGYQGRFKALLSAAFRAGWCPP